jgi:hypothetical protein
MTAPTRWVRVTVAMESAVGSDKTISAITKASPGVVSSTSHGISDGAYVRYSVNGMSQLDGRVLRIDNPATSAWDIEGIDTTSFGTFTSGTAEEITFGTSFTTLMEMQSSGGEQQYENYRYLHEDVERQLPTYRSPQRYNFESAWLPTNAALLAIEARADAGTETAVKVTFDNGSIFVFSGSPECILAPLGQGGGIVRCNFGFNVNGRGKAYAS